MATNTRRPSSPAGPWRNAVAFPSGGYRAVGKSTDPIEGGDRVASTHAVGRDAGAALELDERPMGVGAEDPVDPAGVEPERDEPTLELGDVVSPQHRLAEVEEPIAEGEPALHEGCPGVAADFPVDLEPPRALERPDRRVRSQDRTRRDRRDRSRCPCPRAEVGGRGRVRRALPVRRTGGSDTGGECDRLSSGDVLGQVLEELPLALGADQPLDLLASSHRA